MSIEMEMGWGWNDPILATKMVDCPLCGGDAVVLTNSTMDCWGTETVPPCTDDPITIPENK